MWCAPGRCVRLLERNYQHRRVAALAALAGNPHTPRDTVTDTLSALHPLEFSWIGHQNDVPAWLHTAAAALAPADTNEAALQLLTDEELDRHPDPAAVLQSWLNTPESEGIWSRRDVSRAVLDSRHHTLDHLLALCGTQSQRWTALLKALDYGPTDEKITSGELLDGIQDPTPTSAV